MKIKEMKKKTVNFVKENGPGLAVFGGVAIYGISMFLWGRSNGIHIGRQSAVRTFERDIATGQFVRELESGFGKYKMERFVNEDRMNGQINSFNEAVKLLANPENTKNVTGLVILSKENG